MRLLVDHRERLVRARVALNSTLQWNLHDLWPELALPGGALFSKKWTPRSPGAWRAPSRRCASGSPATSCAACANSPNDQGARAEITELVAAGRAQLVAEPGLRAADRRQARRRDRRRRPLRLRRQARPSRRHRPDPRQLGHAPTATASTAAATARSTPPSTASPSPAPAATPRPRTTSPARTPKARPTATPSAASSATSPAASGSSCAAPPRSRARPLTPSIS